MPASRKTKRSAPLVKNTRINHCSAHSESGSHPDHSAELNRIRRIQGQLTGIESMIQGRRYCPDILIQVRAATSALRALDHSIFERHLHSCVQDAMATKDPKEAQIKVQELLELMSRRG